MYKIRFSDRAIRDLEEIQMFLSQYDEILARKHSVRIADAIQVISFNPGRWAFFFLTGAPYRARLLFVGRSSFWLVYEIDEERRAVNVLRVWNSKQEPESFEF